MEILPILLKLSLEMNSVDADTKFHVCFNDILILQCFPKYHELYWPDEL